MFALQTGARAGEQLALQWGDIDFRSNLVVFRRSSTRGVVGHKKSGREAKVPLTATLEAALKAHRHMRSRLVFCNDDGSPLSLWQLHERLEMVCRRAGLRKVRWHDLRHSFASQLATAGVPIRHIQAWLNHSTIHMSMRYAHLAPDAGAELISALAQSEARRGNGVATN
jgi:integrase